MHREHVLRAAAVGLVVYGLFGFGLLILAYVVASQTFAQIDGLRASLEQERTALVASLRSTSQTLAVASTTFDGVGGTLGEARQSSQQAAQFARDLSGTMNEMGAAMGLQILGVQPLASLSGGFQRAGQQLASLGEDLDRTATALGGNTDDLVAVKASVGQARLQVDQLAKAFDGAQLPESRAETARLFQLAIYGLLIWLGGQALVSVLLGIVLFHWSHRRLRARHAERQAALPARGALVKQ